MSNSYKLATIAVRGGYEGEPTTHSTGVPLYLTNAYSFDSIQHAQDLFSLKEPGNIYSRLSNPTVDILENRMAQLDGGVGALGFASGHAAIFNTMVNLASAGDEIVSSIQIYGGAINMLGVTLRRLGITVKFVDPANIEEWENAITDRTKALFFETIGNPNANVADIEAIAAVGHKHGIPVIADSTFTTPYLARPIEHGADLVIHSATKFLGGHGAVMGGLVVDAGTFEFKGNPRFPLFNQPDESYHGVVFADTDAPFILRLRALITRDLGACMSPFNAYLLLIGIETLPLRMQRHCENSLRIAQFLQSNPDVSFVNYPMLPTSPDYGLIQKYSPKGGGAVFTFGLKGGRDRGRRFVESLELFIHCANVGDSRSIVTHPATTTHSQLSAEQLEAAGISEETVRLSIGLEDCDDLLADLDQAIRRSAE